MRVLIAALALLAALASPAAAQSGYSPSTGSIKFLGSSAGTMTMKPPASFSNFEFDLPATAGTAGQVMLSGGGAGTAMTWATPVGGFCWTADSNTTVVAGTTNVSFLNTSGTITGVHTAAATGSFTVAIEIGGTNVTSCSAISVSGSSDALTTCTAANTVSAGSQISVVISSPSGTPNTAYVCPVISRSVN